MSKVSAAILALLVSCLVFTPEQALSQPSPGFVEDFTTELGGFLGGSVRENPGSGGVDGLLDGFLLISNPFVANFGARSSSSAYAGDYRATGVTHIRFWLKDVGGNQAFEIHFGIGVPGLQNFWQHNVPFTPLENAWSEFEVDLVDSTQFTQIQGSGSFAGAIQNADNILFRHDLPPYLSSPDGIAGEVGIDKIRFFGTSPVHPATWGQIKNLYR